MSPPPPRGRPPPPPSRHLYVANVGPKVGDAAEDVAAAFAAFGEVAAVQIRDPTSARCVVSMATDDAARDAIRALNDAPCAALGGRKIVVRFAGESAVATMDATTDATTDATDATTTTTKKKTNAMTQEEAWCVAARTSDDLGVPGATLILDFVTEDEEVAMLKSAEEDPRWQRLAKRRVLHYGYAFDYGTRDAKAPAGAAMPSYAAALLDRAAALTDVPGVERALRCDQLTVNEYEPGIGLAPHVDTHSAFGGTILTASCGGGAVIEFRLHERDGDGDDDASRRVPSRRAAIYLPPRSLLVMAGEARYRWAHYVPHRKRDAVKRFGGDGGGAATEIARREGKRVSFTFRETRDVAVEGPCACAWPEACDSRMGAAQLLKERARPGAVAAARRAAEAAAAFREVEIVDS